MKRRRSKDGRIQRLLYLTNVAIVITTLFSYLLPLVNPASYPMLAVLCFIIPFMYLLNIVFLIVWSIKRNKKLLLSGIVLLIGIPLMSNFIGIRKEIIPASEADFTVMSYNVRLFNTFKILPKENAANTIVSFFKKHNPDILCIQEYSPSVKIDEEQYPYGHILMQGNRIKSGQAIFSKYPIINKGQIIFKKSINNIIYADIKLPYGEVRVYNMHLQSVRISPDVDVISKNIDSLNKDKSHLMFSRLSMAFRRQKPQVDVLLAKLSTSNFKTILCGDMNNTVFSNTYHRVKGDNFTDAFDLAETGFGATYKFKFFPARIDYIFADKSIIIKQFDTFNDFENSDHFPVMARLQLVISD